LLRSRRGLARSLRETRRREPAEDQGKAAAAIEEPDDRVGDVLLVLIKPAVRRRGEVERQVKEGVVGVIAQAGIEVRGQVGVDERAEGTVDATRRGKDGIFLRDIAAIGKIAFTVAPPGVAVPVTVANEAVAGLI
jgi:hypothetical protein